MVTYQKRGERQSSTGVVAHVRISGAIRTIPSESPIHHTPKARAYSGQAMPPNSASPSGPSSAAGSGAIVAATTIRQTASRNRDTRASKSKR